jgi:hypothetical protein
MRKHTLMSLPRNCSPRPVWNWRPCGRQNDAFVSMGSD